MRVRTLGLLRCPFCGGRLEAPPASVSSGEIESGILRCACGEVPVLGGIPIFKREGRLDLMRQSRDAPSSRGPTIGRLLELIRSGRATEALALALLPPGPGIEHLLPAVEALPARWRGRARRRLEHAWIRGSLKDLGALVSPSADVAATAREAFARYERGARNTELQHHFFHRFAQPRHLTSLSLATLLWDDARPGLDLACGFGHSLHALTARRPERTWVGLDRNFFQLYVSRRWVAPGADYVCAEADGPLPFASETFSGALCVDAFHYFLRKRTCVGELLRVAAEDGTIVLARVGNALQEPHEGYELPPEGYAALFPGVQTRLVSDRELLDRYLVGLGPDLMRDGDAALLSTEKWLSVVVSRDAGIFRDYGAFAVWPHGLGRLSLNPLYVPEATRPSDGRTFALTMPSTWFEFENAACRAYMPDQIMLTESFLRDLAGGRRTSEVEDLLRRSVVIGLPQRYL